MIKRVLFLILVSLLINGCANQAPSLRMLDQRAEYTEEEKTRVGLNGLDFVSPDGERVPVRSQSQIATVWIHRHELSSGDMFWGGWASIIYSNDVWSVPDLTSKRLPNRNKKAVGSALEQDVGRPQ